MGKKITKILKFLLQIFSSICFTKTPKIILLSGPVLFHSTWKLPKKFLFKVPLGKAMFLCGQVWLGYDVMNKETILKTGTFSKQRPITHHSTDLLITCTNLARQLSFFSKMGLVNVYILAWIIILWVSCVFVKCLA